MTMGCSPRAFAGEYFSLLREYRGDDFHVGRWSPRAFGRGLVSKGFSAPRVGREVALARGAPTGQTQSRMQLSRERIQRWGLVAGPLAAIGAWLLLPTEFVSTDGETIAVSTAARSTFAVLVLMATWWLTEAIDIAATALLPIALFPLFGARSISEATAPYAADIIYLFLGGFLLARSMARWGLDRRIALFVLRLVGSSPRRLVGGCMATTALLSAFVSNSATAAMMLPIAVSLITLHGQGDNHDVGRSEDRDVKTASERRFSLALLLGIAYSASIGGMATVIGSPPNALLVSFLQRGIAEPYRADLSYAQWLGFALPLVFLMLPLTWLLLTRVLFPITSEPIPGGTEHLNREYAKLGGLKPGELATMVVFFVTAALWISRPLLKGLPGLSGLSDAGIAMLGGLTLFVIPIRFQSREFVMDWRTASTLPWDVLVLFGGGLSLAAAIQANGVAEFFGAQANRLAGAPTWLTILAIVTAVVFLTELTSNTATIATLLPILAAAAPALDVHPYLLIVPATVSASCAFMMPVATPPNAIVFGSGLVSLPQMARAGLWLNTLSIGLITTLVTVLVRVFLGGDAS